ncbi:MAG: hypothetical protein M1167_06910, partial [Chloroflexi bacterium]|nr:hypothetical protein [Chloroflexota bacterium]
MKKQAAGVARKPLKLMEKNFTVKSAVKAVVPASEPEKFQKESNCNQRKPALTRFRNSSKIPFK